MAPGGKLRVLGEPAHRRLFLGRTASLVGDGIAPVALAFAILDLTGSATDLGIVLAVHSLVLSVDGASTAFFNPASNAIVPQIVPGRRLQEANALLTFSRWMGKVAGPALAGVLLALGSPGSAAGRGRALGSAHQRVSSRPFRSSARPSPASPSTGPAPGR